MQNPLAGFIFFLLLFGAWDLKQNLQLPLEQAKVREAHTLKYQKKAFLLQTKQEKKKK